MVFTDLLEEVQMRALERTWALFPTLPDGFTGVSFFLSLYQLYVRTTQS